MSEEKQNREAKVSVFIAYASMIGLAVWRGLSRKSRAAVVRHEEAEEALATSFAESPTALPAPPSEEPLESLSQSTPGDAPLDRLARRAEFEEQESAVIRPGGGVADPKLPQPEGPPQPWTSTSKNVADLLATQSLESQRLSGWSSPMPDRLPVPTYAPAVMALGIVIFAMGLATTWYVCVIGASVFAVAAWRWTGELQGE
jgi:hypothetical protein